tara:strand:- start:3068 stop:4147 length:1080 start_codon:yes stop_codon:yes gene_type:complete
MTMISKEQILSALKNVIDPELHQDIVTLGMVKDIQVDGDAVALSIELTTPACPLKEQIERDIRSAVEALPGVATLDLKMTGAVRGTRVPDSGQLLPAVKNVIAVASGKGGVGKSTIAANVAVAMAETGAKIGILDADIYGPNMPKIMGVKERPTGSDKRIVPPKSYGVKVMSLAFFVTDETALIWRGPMVASTIRQFLTDVEWGELDYLIVDLPPGTGDASLTLAQSIPLSGVIIVTTPQDAALTIATKSLQMFRKLNVPVLGMVENMSYFLCPHCQERTEIFGHGGGQEASKQLDATFLGEVPLDRVIREKGDEGYPIVVSEPNSPLSEVFRKVGRNAAGRISVVAASQPAGDLPIVS